MKFLAPGQRIKKEIQDAATILLKKRLYNKKITANSDSKIVHSDVIDIDNLEPVTKKLKFEWVRSTVGNFKQCCLNWN